MAIKAGYRGRVAFITDGVSGIGFGIARTHIEFAGGFRTIYETNVAALPDEPVPEGRMAIERLRRAAVADAAAGKTIGLADLT